MALPGADAVGKPGLRAATGAAQLESVDARFEEVVEQREKRRGGEGHHKERDETELVDHFCVIGKRLEHGVVPHLGFALRLPVHACRRGNMRGGERGKLQRGRERERETPVRRGETERQRGRERQRDTEAETVTENERMRYACLSI